MNLKQLVSVFFMVASIYANAQNVDTVIVTNAYTSYYSYSLHEPLYVVYKLYKGGGSCGRQAFYFKTEGLPNSATPADYSRSGFDEGHLADAKDFAYDCEKEEATFRFFNCVPQTPRLNRGIWKHFETLIRSISQSDSLLIVCGSIFGTKTMGPDSIAIPDWCWKIAISLTTNQVVHCFICPNDNSDSFQELELPDLKKRIGYTLTY